MTFSKSFLSISSLALSLFQASAEDCSVVAYLGQTMFIPAFGQSCLKIELFPEGMVYSDGSDPTCSNEVYGSNFGISSFAGFEGSVASFDSITSAPFKGVMNFKLDTAVTDPVVTANAISLKEKIFNLDITVPSCDTSPPYPCYYKVVNETIFRPMSVGCLKIGLSEGGEISVDVTDPACSKPKSEYTTSAVLATYSGGKSNKIMYEANGPKGFNGIVALGRDPAQAEKIKFVKNKIDTKGKTFELGIMLKSCTKKSKPPM